MTKKRKRTKSEKVTRLMMTNNGINECIPLTRYDYICIERKLVVVILEMNDNIY